MKADAHPYQKNNEQSEPSFLIGEGNFLDIEILVNYLNSLPERSDSQVLAPINMKDLNWEMFQMETNLSIRAIRSIQRQFVSLTPHSKRHQIYSYSEILQYNTVVQIKSIKKVLGYLFDCTKATIYSFIHSYNVFKKSAYQKIGRPKTLADEHLQILFNEISTKLKKYDPMSKTDIVQFVRNEFGKSISKKYVSRLIKENEELILTDAYPLIDERTNITKKQIFDYFAILTKVLEDADPDLVFNVDEIGFSRKNNGKKKRVIVRKSDYDPKSKRKIFYEKETDLTKTFSLIACIALSGDYLKPMIIAPVQSCPNEFFTESIWPGRDCILGHSESGYNNMRLFEIWFNKVFIPHIKEVRSRIGPEKINKRAYLICDGMEGHNSDMIKAIAAKENVMIIFLPPHSSHLLQALDKYFFANIKYKYYSGNLIINEVDRNSRKIIKILKAFYMSCSPFAIRSSFKAIGINSIWDYEGNYLGISVDSSAIINNHQDKIGTFIHEKTNYRKRQNFEVKENYIVNRFQLSENSFGICPLCHQICQCKSIETSLIKNKIEIMLAIIQSFFEVIKILLNSYLLSDNSIEFFKIDSNKEIDDELIAFDSVISGMNFDENIKDIIIDCEFLIKTNTIITMLENKINSKLEELVEKKDISSDLFDLTPEIEKSLPFDYDHYSYPGVRGLINHMNECAVNSVIQILLHTLPFVRFLLSDWDKIIDPNNAPLTRLLTYIAIQLWGAPVELDENYEIPPINQEKIIHFLEYNYHINFIDQQDAHEILTTIISQIDSEFSSIKENPIKKIFYGTLKTEIICKECGNSKHIEHEFNILSIPFVNQKNNQLEKMLKKWCGWTTEKKYDDICPKCQKKGPVKIRTIIESIPMIFFMTVPRYEEKNYNIYVSAPDKLNIERIIHNIEPVANENRSKHALYGFICHHGDIQNGHYISHINVGIHDWKSEDTLTSVKDKWVLFDDSKAKDDCGYLKYLGFGYLYAYCRN